MVAVADLHRQISDAHPLGPTLLILMQFSVKFGQKNKLASGKSWDLGILNRSDGDTDSQYLHSRGQVHLPCTDFRCYAIQNVSGQNAHLYYLLTKRAFWIAQVPLALPFECNQPNGNLADLWSTKLQFSRFWKKINIYSFNVYRWIIIRLISVNLPNSNLAIYIQIVNIYHFPKSTKLSFSDYT